MLTMKYIIAKDYPIDHILTEFDKAELKLENLSSNYSYVCLMNEMLSYKGTTVNDLFNGWSGVKLFTIPKVKVPKVPKVETEYEAKIRKEANAWDYGMGEKHDNY